MSDRPHSRARLVCRATSGHAWVRVHLPSVVTAAELMADLADARLECDALRVLLAMSRGLLTEAEAGDALGVSAEKPPTPVSGGPGLHRTSPLTMHVAEQAARGMDLASRRLGMGGVIGEPTHMADGRPNWRLDGKGTEAGNDAH